MKITFETLALWSKGRWTNAYDLNEYRNLSCNFDTRNIRPGQCFLAINSGKNDGHAYVREAWEKGASAAIVEKADDTIPLPQLVVENVVAAFHNIAKNFRKHLSIPIIGLTGSWGKTTTKDLLALLLGEVTTGKTIGNFNNYLGVPLTLTNLDAEKHSHAVVEVGISEPNEMVPLAKIVAPDAGIVLNVAPVHLGNFDNSLEAIAKEKCVLLDYVQPNGKIFFFANLLRYECFQRFADKAFILTGEPLSPSIANQVTYTAEHLKPNLWKLTLTAKDFNQEFLLPFAISRSFISNFAMTLTVAMILGVAPSVLQERLLAWKPSDKRGEWLTINGQTFFVDCYNANPVTMLESIQVFQMQAPSNLPHLYVIGEIAELGRASESYHFEMGTQIKVRPQDKIILVGENMRPVYEGLIKAGNDIRQISRVSKTEEIGMRIQEFNGPIFLKGSRYHRLERLTNFDRFI